MVMPALCLPTVQLLASSLLATQPIASCAASMSHHPTLVPLYYTCRQLVAWLIACRKRSSGRGRQRRRASSCMQGSAVCHCPSHPRCLQDPSLACHPLQAPHRCLQDQHQQQQQLAQQVCGSTSPCCVWYIGANLPAAMAAARS